jgi:hypothetical protein
VDRWRSERRDDGEAVDGAAACDREGKKLVALGKGEMA